MAIWWFLFRSNIEWPFVLQFSSSPFDFCLLPFWWVPSLVRSISMTLGQIYFLQCSSYGEVDFVDLEARFCFLLVTFLWCSRFFWLRGSNLFLQCTFWWSRFRWPQDTILFPFWWPSYGVVDFVDFEVVIYFLQCASFGGVDRFDPEARIWFLQCTYFNGVDFFDPEARDYFLQWITLWHPDSGLFGNCCCR